jgi:hypothetical protein
MRYTTLLGLLITRIFLPILVQAQDFFISTQDDSPEKLLIFVPGL